MAKESGILPSINVYQTTTQLASETAYVPFGSVVLVTGSRQWAMAQYTTSGSDVTTSTGTDPLGNTHTIYWAPITT